MRSHKKTSKRKISNKRSRKKSNKKEISRKFSRKKSSRKKPSIKKHSRRKFKMGNEEYIPYSEKDDVFYNIKPIKVISTEEYDDETPYDYLSRCIENNDDQSFIQYISDNPDIDIFAGPDSKDDLLKLAMEKYNNTIVNAIIYFEQKQREKGKNNCYQIYSHRYLKLLESQSTSTRKVDFYIEEWLFFKNNYRKRFEKNPLNIMVNNNCFYDRKTNKCLYPNIRWQSGDPREIIIDELIFTGVDVIKNFVNTNKLLDFIVFKERFQEATPLIEMFLKADFNKESLLNFFNSVKVFKKQIDKQDHRKEEIIKSIGTYIKYSLEKDKDALDRLKNIITPLKNLLDTYEEDYDEEDYDDEDYDDEDYNSGNDQFIQLYELDDYFNKNAKKEPETEKEYMICEELIRFIDALGDVTCFILDIYTILRILKKTDIPPYFVYCYFGHYHIQGLVHYFTEILGKYKIIIKKDMQPVNEMYKTENRCIKFEKGEYIENSQEIRQLSGPVSFYKLEAIDKNTRPYYITLFGDHHGSVRGQCKECNFDFIEYYRNIL